MKSGQMSFNVDKKVFSDDIDSSEMTTMVNNLESNKLSYLTNFRKYRNEMIDKRARAQSLQSTQSLNINSRQALLNEINNKQLEIVSTQSDLKSLKAQSEALRQQIINYEKAINIKKTDVMDPAQQKLKETIQNLNALVAQRAINLQKISGIVPINSDDLAQSTIDLKAKLSTLKATYMEADPKSAEFSTLIAHLDTQMDTIPTVIA
jgi:chromosome segregation ATPase